MERTLKDLLPMLVLAIVFAVALGKVKRNVIKRWLSLGYLGFLTGWFIYLGNGWLLNGIPIKYVGYLLGIVTILGVCGVNIWYGGPIDKRLDGKEAETPPQDDESVAEKPEELDEGF